MNRVLTGLVDDFCVVYLDDVLVFSRNQEDHVKHVRAVLQRFHEYGLVANVDKCRFGLSEVEYCGHLVSAKGIKPDPHKISAVATWPTPTSLTEVRSFLGLANYYRRFVHRFSELAKPLTELTKKDCKFLWADAQQSAFDALKAALVSSPVCVAPDFSLPMHVWADACLVSIGGVLTQDHGRGHQPIAFFSHKLSDEESRYPAHEREALAVIGCLRAWRHYVFGQETVVHTDHQPLTWLRGIQKPRGRLFRWLQELEEYGPQMQYQPGALQPADAPSRRPQLHDATTWLSDADPAGLLDPPATLHQLDSIPVGDLDRDWPAFAIVWLETGRQPADLPMQYAQRLRNDLGNFVIKHRMLMRKVNIDGVEKTVPFVLSTHRDALTKAMHQTLGHLAASSVLPLLQQRYWWPRMEDEVKAVISACTICDLHRQNASGPIPPLHPTPGVPLPFERWGIDVIQDLPPSHEGNTQIFTAIDYATRWVVAKAYPSRDAKCFADFLFHEIVVPYGAPNEIVTDRANIFQADWIKSYLHKLKILHLPSSPYHPQSNGAVERMHSTLGTVITKLCAGNSARWEEVLPRALFALRVRKHTVTGRSPFYLLYGVEPRLPMDGPELPIPPLPTLEPRDWTSPLIERDFLEVGRARNEARVNTDTQATRMQAQHDSNPRVTNEPLPLGSKVKVRHFDRRKFEMRWTGPYRVVQHGPNHTYFLMRPDGSRMDTPLNGADLAPCTSAADDEDAFYDGTARAPVLPVPATVSVPSDISTPSASNDQPLAVSVPTQQNSQRTYAQVTAGASRASDSTVPRDAPDWTELEPSSTERFLAEAEARFGITRRRPVARPRPQTSRTRRVT
eukprot:jgi/Hompol1/2378/HPOL_005977-RA